MATGRSDDLTRDGRVGGLKIDSCQLGAVPLYEYGEVLCKGQKL